MIMTEKKTETKKKAKPAAKKAEKPKAKQPKKAEPKKAVKKGAAQAPQTPQEKKALILSFRRGRHTQRTNQFLVEVKGADSKTKASLYIGKRVVWTSPGKLKKQIFGKITNTHGNSGVLRARFSRGLPGTAVGTKVDMLDK